LRGCISVTLDRQAQAIRELASVLPARYVPPSCLGAVCRCGVADHERGQARASGATARGIVRYRVLDAPIVATRQVRGRHRVQVIRRSGTMPGGMGSRLRVLKIQQNRGFRTPLTVGALA
jgi:hypothetical protein